MPGKPGSGRESSPLVRHAPALSLSRMGARSIEVIHLPGEREAFESARVMRRENSWNPEEWDAWRAAMICWETKERYEHHGRNWRCTHKNPCMYCRDLR